MITHIFSTNEDIEVEIIYFYFLICVILIKKEYHMLGCLKLPFNLSIFQTLVQIEDTPSDALTTFLAAQ